MDFYDNMNLFDIKVLLILFIYSIVMIPSIANASVLTVREVSFRWNNNQNHYNSTDIVSKNINSILFDGVNRTNSTDFQWPYDMILFYLNKPNFDTSKTYDIDFVAFINQNANHQTIARVNGTQDVCNTVSESGNMVFFSCKNVKLVNNNTNYILISFKNNGFVSKQYFAGLAKLNFVPSGSSNTDEIIQYMQIMEQNQKNQNQAIIDNQDKNSQEQIDNANKNHQETMNTITNSTVDSDGISSLGGTDLPTNGVLSSILNFPVNFFNTLSNTLSVGQYSCRPVVLTIPFVNYDFTYPCLNQLMRQMGVYDWWQSIGWVAGGVTLWFYLLYLGKKFNDMSNLKEGDGGFGGL